MAGLSRKHFQILATAIREERRDVFNTFDGDSRTDRDEALVNLANRLANEFEKDSPSFDRKLFLEATRPY